MMNRKAASLSGFSEAIIGVLLFLGCVVTVMVSMNHDYGTNYDPTFGIATNDTATALNNYPDTLKTGVEGEASTNAIQGVNVVAAYGIVKEGLSIVFQFLTGGFIQNAVGLLNLGQAGVMLGLALRLLFILAVGFILIKIIFKVKA